MRHWPPAAGLKTVADDGQQDPAVEASGDAGHEATDDKADQGRTFNMLRFWPEVVTSTSLPTAMPWAVRARPMGEQRYLPDGLGAEQQVQRGDDGQRVKRQGQNRDHDHNQVVVKQAFMDKRAVYLAQDMLASCARG